MSATRDVAAFEVLRFEAVPAAAGVALLELDGRFAGPAPQRTRLLIESGGRSLELPAVVADDAEQSWSATFAMPLDVLDDPGAGFGLVVGRGRVIGLPAPFVAGGEDDRFVRLARGANDLRHQLAEASASAASAVEAYSALTEERDGLVAELDALRARAEAAEQSATDAAAQASEVRAAAELADQQAAEARAELEDVRAQLAAETTRAEAGEAAARDAEARREQAAYDAEQLREEIIAAADHAEELKAKIVAAEDEVRAARFELRDTRARLEALKRERRLPHAYHAPVRPPEEPEGPPLEWEDDTAPTAPVTVDSERAETEAAADEPTAPIAVEEPAASEGAESEADPEADPDAIPGPRTPNAHRAPRRTIKLEAHDDDIPMEPAAVGARLLERGTHRPPLTALTPERIAVGVALLVLFIALVIILLGGGLV